MITQLLLLLMLALPMTSTAEVTNVALLERSDVLDGISMHKAGPYERIIAKAHFAIDPEMPINRIITDIQHATRNEHGQVEFSADLYVLKPRDPAKSNGTLLFEVVNRGRKGLNRQFNFGTIVQDPRNARDEYLARLGAAAHELVSQRYLMERDVALIVDAGARQWDYTTSSGSPDRGQ